MEATAIDTHLHVWQRSRSSYRWLEGAPQSLQADHLLPQALAAIEPHGFQHAVLVQADETLEETAYLLELVAAEPRLLGAVCYLPLEDPATVARMLPELADDPGFVGVRNLTHDRPDPDWLLGAEQRRSIELIERAGVPLDYVATLPRHRENLVTLAREHAGLTFVLDHLGTPPVGDAGERHALWLEQVSAVAGCPNVVAKVSGVYRVDGGGAVSRDELASVVSTAIELFGAHRLMIGSDWPVCEARGEGAPTLSALAAVTAALPPEQREALAAGTARRVYGLGDR